MKIFDLEEYIEFYNQNGRTYDYKSHPRGYNEKQLKTLHKKYVNREQRASDKRDSQYQKQKEKWNQAPVVDEKWLALKKVIIARDVTCRFIRLLSVKEYKIFMENSMPSLINTLDGAHIISRSQSTKGKYDSTNVILLNRVAHGRIDFMRDPITNQLINKEQHRAWWIRLVGKELLEELEAKYIKKYGE